MVWTLEISLGVSRDLSRVDSVQRKRITRFLRIRQMPFEAPWAGYRKYRVGDFRVTSRIEETRKCIQVTRVAHRRDIYR